MKKILTKVQVPIEKIRILNYYNYKKSCIKLKLYIDKTEKLKEKHVNSWFCDL